MTLQEFTARTGIYPDNALYGVIKAHCGVDMDAFCEAYKKNADGLAEVIQREANNIRSWMERKCTVEFTRLIKQLDEAWEALGEALTELDREADWKPYNGHGTNMSQDEYDELLELCTDVEGEANSMPDGEARKLIVDEFGFSPDRIEIVYTVNDYEINRHNELREAAEYKRPPLYVSSDRNYIRFNVTCAAAVRRYEMIDGGLEEYCR